MREVGVAWHVRESQKKLSHIFISYSKVDRSVAEALARGFEERGWDVWFDRFIKSGPDYRSEIDRALKKAGCVVVLWSRHSVESRWVIWEADFARDHEILVPAVLDGSELPPGFKRQHCIDLQGWTGGTSAALSEAYPTIRRLMGRPHVVREYSSAGHREALADGAWHRIAGPFSGIQALHVLATVSGKKGTGRYGIVEAIALNAFNPPSTLNPFGDNFLGRKTAIRTTHAVYRDRRDRLRLRWKGEPHEYYLEVASQVDFGEDDYGRPVAIDYSVRSLWSDPYGRRPDRP